MSQHDLSIANQGFPAFRSDLNDALQALGSMQSGTSAPSTTYANMLWYDTTNNIVKMRNEDNDAWISLFTLDQSGDLVSAISAATGTFGALSATGNVTLGDSSSDTATVNAKTTFGSEISAPNTFGFKNRIINGAMVIDQRNAGASVSISAAAYTLDRMYSLASGGGVYTVQQSSTVPSSTGFRTSAVYTVTTADSSIAATDYYAFDQRIEGYNVADLNFGNTGATPYTVSFWVRSSITGTYSVAFFNADANRSYVTTYTVNAANTWEQKTITVTPDTSGTWLTTNGIGVVVRFGLGCGSTYTTSTLNAWQAGLYFNANTATNWISNSGATFYITGVQLEKGTQATSFDFRSYGTELALCQRYCFRIDSASSHFCMAYADTTTVGYGTVFFPVQMRSTSGMSLTTTGTYSNYTLGMAGVGYTVTGMNLWSATVNDAQLQIGVASGLTAGRAGSFGANTNAFLMFTSEL